MQEKYMDKFKIENQAKNVNSLSYVWYFSEISKILLY